MRASRVLRATLRVPDVYKAGKVGLKPVPPAMKDTVCWSVKFLGSLGARFVAAPDGAAICGEFADVQEADVPQALLTGDPTDKNARSVQKWIHLLDMKEGRMEATVDHYVGEVMHACDVDDDSRTFLLSKKPIPFAIGAMGVVSIPDLSVGCSSGFEEVQMMPVIVEESKLDYPDPLAWGQVGGEMIAAASRYNEAAGSPANISIFGIRIIETRWTFLRADFTEDYLDRLKDYQLLPDDNFPIFVWGGEDKTRLSRQDKRTGLFWGLDFRAPSERAQILRMLVAMGRQVQATAAKLP